MRTRHPNPRKVKINRNYTVEEIAILFGIHKNTVRSWIKVGLATCDARRPILIHGRDLTEFLKTKRTKNKKTCQPGQFYCVCCRDIRGPAGNMAEFQPVTDRVGNLVAICPDCDRIMNRRVSIAKLTAIIGNVEVSFPQALEHINESSEPTVISDLKEDK